MHIRVKGLLLSMKSDQLVFRIQRVGELTGMGMWGCVRVCLVELDLE